MIRILVVFAVAAAAVSAFAQPVEKEIVSSGDVVAISEKNQTLTVKEIAEPPANSPPGTMQSGVVREFVVKADTKLEAQGQPIQLADIKAGDRVTIHYVLDSGKNVARRIAVAPRATDS